MVSKKYQRQSTVRILSTSQCRKPMMVNISHKIPLLNRYRIQQCESMGIQCGKSSKSVMIQQRIVVIGLCRFVRAAITGFTVV